MISITGCAHHLTQNQISSILNNRIGKPYIANGDKLIRDSEGLMEYIHKIGEGCSVIYKVDKNTNLAKSWMYLGEAESCQDGLNFYGWIE